MLADAAAGVMAALEALLRLRQAACHPALLPGQTRADVVEARGLLEALRPRSPRVTGRWCSRSGPRCSI